MSRPDLREIFSSALRAELIEQQTVLAEQEPQTAALHAALDSLWWNRQHLRGWPPLANRLVAQFEELLALKGASPESIHESVEDLENQLFNLRRALFATAYDRMSELAAPILEQDPTLSFEQAFARAVKAQPDIANKLYKEDIQEDADAADGLSFADSLSVYGTRQHAEKQATKKTPKRRGNK